MARMMALGNDCKAIFRQAAHPVQLFEDMHFPGRAGHIQCLDMNGGDPIEELPLAVGATPP
jgi:hypothetical protein